MASTWWRIWQAIRGANNTFIKERDVPKADFTGKWIIISGANNGVGFEAAKFFSKCGANLVLACREPPKWEQHPSAAIEECKALAAAQGHSSTIEWWEIDMAQISSVEAFCQRWLESDRPLDVLCNNAGTIMTPKTSSMTADGFQLVHQVNLLSHVLLTLRLLPSLARSAQPRIVCTTSSFHFMGRFELENFNGGPGQKGGSYGNNKLYFQMWVAELQSRLLKHNEYLHITVNGVNPGFVKSGIWQNIGPTNDFIGRTLKFLLPYLSINAQQGSIAIINAATNPKLGPDPEKQGVGSPEGRGGGKYINRIWEAVSMPQCGDVEARAKVWAKLNEELKLQEKGLLDILGL